mgnify:CR=1 FL=1
MKDWTKEDVFDAEVAPLMEKIISVCEKHRMPFLATFQYASDAVSHSKNTLTGTAMSQMRQLDQVHSVLFLVHEPMQDLSKTLQRMLDAREDHEE